jgi:hypothetical protein
MAPKHSLESSPYYCPNCNAKYKLVRMEAKPSATLEPELTCLSCGGPLPASEGAFLLKYFLVALPGARWRADLFDNG